MWLIQRGFVRSEARWEIENKKKNELIFPTGGIVLKLEKWRMCL